MQGRQRVGRISGRNPQEDYERSQQKALLRGPAAVDRKRGAANLCRGIRAEEERKRADLLCGDELPGRLFLGEQAPLRLGFWNFLATREIVDLLLHERRQ